MEIVNEVIKCKVCKKLMNSPVFLPCGESICKIHIERKDKIYCVICDKDHSIPKEGLILNKSLDMIIQTNIHKCDFGQESFDNCKKLEKILEEIELLKKDPCFYICEITDKIKNEIDLRREELKRKIDEEAVKLIEEVEEFKNKCKNNLNEKDHLEKCDKINNEINEIWEKLKIWKNDLKIFESNENKWKDVKQQEEIIKSCESKRYIIKNELILHTKFKINVEKTQDFIKIQRSDQFHSIILDSGLEYDLIDLCNFPKDQKWTLLFRASEHGFSSTDFHQRCDNKPKTLTIIKSSNGNIFGGYTEQRWDSDSRNKYDRNAFLFSLINLYNKKAKINSNLSFYNFSIYCDASYGPAFGSGANELCLSQGSNNMKQGYSTLSNCYPFQAYPHGSNGGNFLAGSPNFEANEIEVLMKNEVNND